MCDGGARRSWATARHGLFDGGSKGERNGPLAKPNVAHSWQAKAAAAAVSLSELLRQAMARTQTWTAPAREVERERTRQIARIGSNLNQIAR